jgi:hypothetical protein
MKDYQYWSDAAKKWFIDGHSQMIESREPVVPPMPSVIGNPVTPMPPAIYQPWMDTKKWFGADPSGIERTDPVAPLVPSVIGNPTPPFVRPMPSVIKSPVPPMLGG